MELEGISFQRREWNTIDKIIRGKHPLSISRGESLKRRSRSMKRCIDLIKGEEVPSRNRYEVITNAIHKTLAGFKMTTFSISKWLWYLKVKMWSMHSQKSSKLILGINGQDAVHGCWRKISKIFWSTPNVGSHFQYCNFINSYRAKDILKVERWPDHLIVTADC